MEIAELAFAGRYQFRLKLNSPRGSVRTRRSTAATIA
jgi:hypothetical protein